jgi:hypothetical protein
MEQDTTAIWTQTTAQLRCLIILFNDLASLLALTGYDGTKALHSVRHAYSVVEDNREAIPIEQDNLSKLFWGRSEAEIGRLEMVEFATLIEKVIESSGLDALAPTRIGNTDLAVTDWSAFENDTVCDSLNDASSQRDHAGLSIFHPTLSSPNNPRRMRAKRVRRAKRAKEATKPKPPFALSRKQDLTEEEVRLVANHLVNGNVEEFLEEGQLIKEARMSSLNVTYDTIESLSRNNRNRRAKILKMRFGYTSIHERVKLSGLVRPKVVESYLNDKTTSKKIRGDRLNLHLRIAERFHYLAGPTPFLLCIFSRGTETIVYVLKTPSVLLSILNTSTEPTCQ